MAALGPSGYKKLVKLASRAFFAGPCPPREAEAPQPSSRNKFAKVDTTGLAIIVLDTLTRKEWIKEDELADELKLHPKMLRRCMRYLEQEGFVQREHRKETKRGAKRDAVTLAAAVTAAPAADDEDEIEGPARSYTHSYCALDYAVLFDSLQYRLHVMRKTIKEELEGKDPMQNYLCPSPQCQSQYSSLDALSLPVSEEGEFCCERCGAVLQQVFAPGKAGDDAARRQRRETMRALQSKMEAQLRPLVELVTALRDVTPPDFGSLNDWAINSLNEQRRAAGGGRTGPRMRGPGSGELDGIDTYWEQTRVSVDLAGGAAATSNPAFDASSTPGDGAKPKRPLVPWLLGQSAAQQAAMAASPASEVKDAKYVVKEEDSKGGDSKGDTKAAVDEDVYAAYIAQYMAQVNALQRKQDAQAKEAMLPSPAKPALGVAAAGGVKREAPHSTSPAARPSKMQRTADRAKGAAAAPVTATAAVAGTAAAVVDADGEEWEDAGGPQHGGGAGVVSPAAAAAAAGGAADSPEWQAVEEAATPAPPRALGPVTPPPDDDLEWEDI